jgi:esterase
MKLFYRKYGSGPPLVILHGLYGSSDNWVTIAKRLGDNFTVYLPDQRNHGQSPHSVVHDYDSMRDDIYELVTDLGITKFFLAGHSMGGKTAAAFAIRWPEMLNGLLIADITPFAGQPNADKAYKQHLLILEAMSSLDTSEITSREQVENALKKRISSAKIRGFIMKNLQRTPENRFLWKINVSSLLKNLDSIMGGIDRREAYSKQVHGFPVIFLRGTDSDYLRTSDYDDIKKLFPSAEIVEIKKAGHWLHADQPEAVISSLLKLLSDRE